MLNVERKVKHIDTKPLTDPLNRWGELTRNEQNAVARIMIDKVLISDETGIDIHFSFDRNRKADKYRVCWGVNFYISC